jgi:hypothetical protein
MFHVRVFVKIDEDRIGEVDKVFRKTLETKGPRGSDYDFRTHKWNMYWTVGTKEEAEDLCERLELACQDHGLEGRTEITPLDA